MSLMQESRAFRPFRYPWAADFWQNHEDIHWVKAQAPVSDDVEAWKSGKLSATEKHFVTQILRMFTQSDVNVGTFYYDLLIPRIKNNEVRVMLGGFANREGTHQHAYSMVNDTLGLPEGDYAAFLDYAEMAEKHEFMLDADPSTPKGLALALAKGVFNEGLSLFASFVMLLNFERRGLMKGMCKVVAWSIRDENMHVEGVSRTFRTFCEEHPEIVTDDFKREIYSMGRRAVELEDHFVDLAYKMGPISGLEPAEVKRYLRYICDRRLTQLGLKPNFGIADNPLMWVDYIVSGKDHSNFFEEKSAEYADATLTGDWLYPRRRPRRVRIFTRTGCGFCVQAKALLTLAGIEYDESDLSDYETRQLWFDQCGFIGEARSMPKIYDIGQPLLTAQLIGGFSELDALLQNSL